MFLPVFHMPRSVGLGDPSEVAHLRRRIAEGREEESIVCRKVGGAVDEALGSERARCGHDSGVKR